MPTASVPGKGLMGMVMFSLNFAVRVFQSMSKYCTWPSGYSGARAPMVGKSLPGKLKFVPTFLGTILRMRISSTSPGIAPLTKTGPVSE
jgi:hypothetical protein